MSKLKRGLITSTGTAIILAVLWLILVEAASSPAQRAYRARGCFLCHGSAPSSDLSHVPHGAPLRPELQEKLLRAHPKLTQGAEPELVDYLYAAQLPNLVAARSSSQGEMLYLAKCATCHGKTGGGTPPEIPPLAGSEWLAADPAKAARLPEILEQGLKGPITVKGIEYNAEMTAPRITEPNEQQSIIQHLQKL